MGSKINQLLQDWPAHIVGTQTWLNTKGVDFRLADKYVRSGWLTRLGHGAYVRAGSSVDWPGAVYALQTQLRLDVHPGAITAFELRGYAHYLALGGREVVLFAKPGTKLPAWFRKHRWSQQVLLVTSSMLESHEDALSTVKVTEVALAVATLERAAFEMMYLVPKRQSFEEASQVMESLTSLRPRVVQRLLETCRSVKTKRLFMHAAERLNHPWVSALDLSRVDFGSGKRTIHPRGRLDPKYNLIVADTDYE
ncbi:MAG: type IV toxin-antitoxin system AbiEi family antitoxin [Pseudomonadales bacterium]